ncbi:MAG: V-type ATP synthase subunit E, partial [Oscillospiraceae bacterium]|nr:V-type ATP synthase subunit E [Oscillospiraceae bacterium]
GKYALLANKAEFEAHKDILRYRNSLVDKLFSEVKEKLSEFRKTDEYRAFLEKSLENEKKSDNMIVYLMSDDMKYKDILSKIADVEFKVDASIKLGGLSVCYPDELVIVDKTFDTLLSDEKRNFASGGTLMLDNE